MTFKKGDRVRAAKATTSMGRRHGTIVAVMLAGWYQVEFKGGKGQPIIRNALPEELKLVRRA